MKWLVSIFDHLVFILVMVGSAIIDEPDSGYNQEDYFK